MKTLAYFCSISLFFLFTLTTCGPQSLSENRGTKAPNHLLWDSLLSDHVNEYGLVDYRGFISDSIVLNNYLSELATNSPSIEWSTDDQLAYWINLYNASTVKLVIQHYPIKSIKDIGSRIQIPFVNTPWQKEFITVLDNNLDLDDIEHNIIREQFNEPRIHFALVCAAMSCPKLRNEAYQGNQLDHQLSDQAKVFLNDDSKNKLSENHIIISKLFNWYGRDFKKTSTLIEYLNGYSPIKIDKNAKVEFMDYNWRLNSR